jgi:hypothetical protein
VPWPAAAAALLHDPDAALDRDEELVAGALHKKYRSGDHCQRWRWELATILGTSVT